MEGVLAPYREELLAVVVESTYNWYWLVDGLQDLGYPVRLAHPAGNKPYSGVKHTDDQDDAFFLADLARVNSLREGIGTLVVITRLPCRSPCQPPASLLMSATRDHSSVDGFRLLALFSVA